MHIGILLCYCDFSIAAKSPTKIVRLSRVVYSWIELAVNVACILQEVVGILRHLTDCRPFSCE